MHNNVKLGIAVGTTAAVVRGLTALVWYERMKRMWEFTELLVAHNKWIGEQVQESPGEFPHEFIVEIGEKLAYIVIAENTIFEKDLKKLKDD